MKASVERKEMERALDTLSLIVKPRAIAPELSCVLMEWGNAEITMFGTDMRTAVRLKIPATSEEAPPFAVPLDQLRRFVKAQEGEGVQLTLKDRLTVKMRGSMQLNLSTEQPPMPDELGLEGVKVAMTDIARLVSLTAFAASREPSRPELNGVYWWWDEDGKMVMAASDVRVLAEARAESLVRLDGMLLPASGMELLVRLLDVEEEVRVARTHRYAVVTGARATVHVRQIDGTFPPYRRLLATAGGEKTVDVGRDELLRMLKGLAPVAQKEFQRVVLKMGDGKIRAHVSNPEAGEAEDEVAAEVSSPVETISNLWNLIDVLDTIPSERVRLALQNSESNLMVGPAGEDYCTFLVARMHPN